jgi:amidophosphoribosyltransferase
MLNPEVAPAQPKLGYESEVPGHECGVYIEVSAQPDITFYGMAAGTNAINNRGSDAFGGYIYDDESTKFIGLKETGTVQKVLAELSDASARNFAVQAGTVAISQVRYSTVAGLNEEQQIRAIQPYLSDPEHETTFAGSINGNVDNAYIVGLEHGIRIADCPTDSIAMLRTIHRLADESGDMVGTLTDLQEQFSGAYSMVLAYEDKVYGIRDPNGLRPLCIGQRSNGAYIIASESVALDARGATYIREVEPGEIVEISQEHGTLSLQSYDSKIDAPETFCSMDIAYFMDGDSIHKNKFAYMWREELGRQVARETVLDKDSVVIGVPDSGLAAARAFADEAGLDYIQPLQKIVNSRAFMAPTPEERREIAANKLSLDAPMLLNSLRGSDGQINRRLTILDDTVVRGDSMSALAAKLVEAGVPSENIDIVIPFPEITEGCHLGTALKQDQLLSYQRTYREKCEQLGVASLTYLSVEGFQNLLPDSCLGCCGEEFPVSPLSAQEAALVGKLALNS